jgi:uncharacterized protein (TIGR02145 family)
MKNSTFIRKTGIGVFALILFSFSLKAQSVKDMDGNVYKTIKYGVQEWLSVNLNVSHFRNGEVIPEVKTAEEWIKAGTEGKPAWCYYSNDPENGKKYGKLYNWYAINDPRGLAPTGWHISKNMDWMTLVKNLLGVDDAGLKLKSVTGWKTRKGSDKIGFSALPGGYRDKNGDFKDMANKCQWWSNSEPVEVKKSDLIYSLMLNDYTVEVSYIKMNKESGLSVRCIKD